MWEGMEDSCMPQMRKNGLAHGSPCRRVREMAGLRGKSCRVGSQTRLQGGNAANASRGAPTLFRRNQAVIRRPGGARVRGTRTYSAGAAGDNRGQSPLKLFQQAGTAFAGAGEGLFVLPGLDELGIAGEQDVGDLPAVELGGTGIDGRGDQAVLEAVGQGRCLVGEDARNEADDAVRQEGGGNLAAAHDKVAHGDFPGDEVLADALVDSLVVAAQDDDVLLEGQFVGHPLVQDFAVGGHVNDFVVIPFGTELLDHPEYRLHHHDHAGVAAVTVVVHGEARPQAVLAEVVDMDFHQAFLDGPAGNGMAQRTFEQLRNHGEDIDAHGFSLSCMQM